MISRRGFLGAMIAAVAGAGAAAAATGVGKGTLPVSVLDDRPEEPAPLRGQQLISHIMDARMLNTQNQMRKILSEYMFLT